MQKGGWKGWARDTRKNWGRKCKTPSMIQIVSEKKKEKKAWMQNLRSLYLGRKGQAWNKALWLLLGEGVEIWNILESQGLKCSTCGLFKLYKKINIQEFKILSSLSFHGPYTSHVSSCNCPKVLEMCFWAWFFKTLNHVLLVSPHFLKWRTSKLSLKIESSFMYTLHSSRLYRYKDLQKIK